MMKADDPAAGSRSDALAVGSVSVSPALAKELLEYLRHAGLNEQAGVLLGRRDQDQITISGLIFPPQRISDRLMCEFDVTSIDVIRHVIGSLTDVELSKENVEIIGWFHSHPRLQLFLSPTDVQTLARWAGVDPRAVAVVADPFLLTTQDKQIAWWRDGTRDGRYVTFDKAAADMVLTLQQATAMAQKFTSYSDIGSIWDIVTAGCVVRWRVLPGLGE